MMTLALHLVKLPILQETVVFQVHVHATDYFDDHFMSYAIVSLSIIKFININNIRIHNSKSLEQSNNTMYISLPYFCYFDLNGNRLLQLLYNVNFTWLNVLKQIHCLF